MNTLTISRQHHDAMLDKTPHLLARLLKESADYDWHASGVTFVGVSDQLAFDVIRAAP